MTTSPPPGWHPRRGEIYVAPVDKQRPVVVISGDSLNSYSLDVCVVPLTRVRRETFDFRPHLPAGEGGLRTDSWAKCDQLATIPRAALRYPPVGILSPRALDKVARGIKVALKLT